MKKLLPKEFFKPLPIKPVILSDERANLLKPVTDSAGFTLVELIVVVAIVGLLSAVSVPNYKRFVKKARASEAKLMLSSIYAVETAYRAEYNSFTACLKQAGFMPEGTHRYYGGGFQVVAATAMGPGPGCSTPSGTPILCNSLEGITGIPGNCNTVNAAFGDPVTTSDIHFTPNAKAGIAPDANMDGDGIGAGPIWTNYFIASARGDTGEKGILDEWLIDHEKALYQPNLGYYDD